MTITNRASVLLAVAAIGVTGCAGGIETALEQLSEARALSANLRLQFTKSGDAGNRAVMAVTEDASSASAREAEQAMQTVQQDVETLRPVLAELRYSTERGLLDEFGTCFAEYRMLNRQILGLAVESSNLKAQRLSFGSSQRAAEAFREAVAVVRPATEGADRWRIDALVATAVGAVREIQMLQAPHIAEADDAAMTSIETRMKAAEETAREALTTLAAVGPPGSVTRVVQAVAALDRFMTLNAEIIVLSRRNSNVRSLALSLGRKRVLAAQCEEALVALQEALEQRGFGGTR